MSHSGAHSSAGSRGVSSSQHHTAVSPLTPRAPAHVYCIVVLKKAVRRIWMQFLRTHKYQLHSHVQFQQKRWLESDESHKTQTHWRSYMYLWLEFLWMLLHHGGVRPHVRVHRRRREFFHVGRRVWEAVDGCGTQRNDVDLFCLPPLSKTQNRDCMDPFFKDFFQKGGFIGLLATCSGTNMYI